MKIIALIKSLIWIIATIVVGIGSYNLFFIQTGTLAMNLAAFVILCALIYSVAFLVCFSINNIVTLFINIKSLFSKSK